MLIVRSGTVSERDVVTHRVARPHSANLALDFLDSSLTPTLCTVVSPNIRLVDVILSDFGIAPGQRCNGAGW